MAEAGAPVVEHKPYVPDEARVPEFTPKAIAVGALFGLIFGASTVYLALQAGLTVSASIPIAVLSISILKKLGGSTILENNIVQTIGSARERIAPRGVVPPPGFLFFRRGPLDPPERGSQLFQLLDHLHARAPGRNAGRPDDGAAAPRPDREGARQ